MYSSTQRLLIHLILLLAIAVCPALGKKRNSRGPLTEVGYRTTATSVVKLIANRGEKVGAGIVVGQQPDGSALILTSYNLVAGQDKVAVVFRNSAKAVTGEIQPRQVDFNLDVALVKARDGVFEPRPIAIEEEKVGLVGETLTIIGHTEELDWGPVEVQISDENFRHLECSVGSYSGIDGAPLVNEKGHMVGLIVSDAVPRSADDRVTLAVKTGVIKPIVNGWLKSKSVEKKWRDQKTSFTPWLWVIGGGFLGGGVVAAISLAGGDSDPPVGLPRPPLPPDQP